MLEAHVEYVARKLLVKNQCLGVGKVRQKSGSLCHCRTSKFAITQRVDTADRKTVAEGLEPALKAVPYRIHTIRPDNGRPDNGLPAHDLPENGIQCADRPRNRSKAYAGPMRFDMIGAANGIEYRPMQPNPLGRVARSGGQSGRMNRTIKAATVKRLHYDSHDPLRSHLADVMAACSFARRLKTLSGPTPYE